MIAARYDIEASGRHHPREVEIGGQRHQHRVAHRRGRASFSFGAAPTLAAGATIALRLSLTSFASRSVTLGSVDRSSTLVPCDLSSASLVYGP
jgi:hypothetical protein